MATLKAQSSSTKIFSNMISGIERELPKIKHGFFAYIGYEAKTRLRNRLLSGQELDYNGFDRSAGGKRKILYWVPKRLKMVKVTSFPVNLFEYGRTLRDGSKQQGKYILTKKLKSIMATDLPGIVSEFDRTSYQKWIDRLDRKGRGDK